MTVNNKTTPPFKKKKETGSGVNAFEYNLPKKH